MIEVDEDSIEGRILRILLEAYPITKRELQKELKAPPKKVEMALISLQRRGVLGIEGTGDTRFITLVRADILFHSRKRRKAEKPILPKSDPGNMFG
ncbi:MAG: hypothetical protein HZB92_07165 [Euryarchaeota archaeon]|nr:hypothetical protein [Euryarchaeota archaeon]